MREAAVLNIPQENADRVVHATGVKKVLGGKLILRGVDFDVNRGEVVVLLGPSGAGKTTLLRTLNGLESLDGGQVTISGQRIGYIETAHGAVRRAPERVLARQRRDIGFVFQHFNLYPHMTALENIWHAPVRVLKKPKSEAVEEARALLTRVGLADRADAHPSGLSGGQQQRVAIARALAMHPKLMLFDEPTSALDPEMTGEVLRVMRDLAAGGQITMIVVTHEISFARQVASRLVVMADGQVVETGTPHEILDHPSTSRTQEFLAKVA
ncbi:amino acid ABC transporter ATP-binding protein [Propionibacterium cyclohexanicum]|nr:amino acid ABC transporter ATP-binding protein [Propionibacterium cyclohexanicum]